MCVFFTFLPFTMKLVTFVFVFVILNCINTFVNGNENDFILDRIKNDTLTCISEDIYEHKQLCKCMKTMPDVNIADDSSLDIVCMSLYDSFLLLCDGNEGEKLKEYIPPDLKQFSKMVDSISKGKTADEFCTTVIKDNESLKSHNKTFNSTALWINLFISAMKDKDACKRICSTANGITLDPLCSLIIWANQLYSGVNRMATEPLQPSANKYDGVLMNTGMYNKTKVLCSILLI